MRTDTVRSRAASPWCFAFLACLLASGCYQGSARNVRPSALASDDGWELVEGVPEVRQVSRQDCGVAALLMVLGYWGIPTTRDEITAVIPTVSDRGIRAATLREFARRKGLQAFLVRGELSDLEHEFLRHRPVLVGVVKRHRRQVYPHYEVVVGINLRKQRILTLDPAIGLRVSSLEGFVAEWAAAGQVALVVIPPGVDDRTPSN